MQSSLKNVLALSAIVLAAQASAQVTLYEREGFEGQSFTSQQRVNNLQRTGSGFNDRASSVTVATGRWEVCEDRRFEGRCIVLRPGHYPNLAAMGLNDRVSSARPVADNVRIRDDEYAPLPVAAQITFYGQETFNGRSFTSQQAMPNMRGSGLRDRVSSLDVVGERWQVCEEVQYRGRCVVLRPGRYDSLRTLGMNDSIASVRPVPWTDRVDERAYAPVPAPAPVAVYDARRRSSERIFQAQVTSVRAVVGTPEQRCWIEKEQVAQQQQDSSVNVPAALIGAVIGGILGHQVGGGSGKDLATVGGVVGGGLLGSKVGRDGQQVATTQDVQRCTTVPSQAKPELWDVTYDFRGQEHRVQMTQPPGATINVNAQGEPRA